MEDFREYIAGWIEYGDGCGCWGEISSFLLTHPKVEVLGFVPSEPDESTGAAILKADGKFYAFTEWQDYTGHGCRCGSTLSDAYDTLEGAWLFGLDEWARRSLQPQFPTLVNP